MCIRDSLGLDGGQELQDLLRLRGRHQLPLLALHVTGVDEAVDRVRARRRRAQPALLHRLGQLLVIHKLARPLHRGEEGGLRVPGRRLGRLLVKLRLRRPGARRRAVGGIEGRKRLRVRGVVLDGGLPVDGEPAGRRQHLALRLETVAPDRAHPGGDVEFRGGVKDGDKAPGDHVIDLRLHVLELLGLLDGRDDRKVVRDLGVVEDPPVRPQPTGVEHLGRVDREVPPQVGERLPAGRDVVLGQRPRVGARIGDCLLYTSRCV